MATKSKDLSYEEVKLKRAKRNKTLGRWFAVALIISTITPIIVSVISGITAL